MRRAPLDLAVAAAGPASGIDLVFRKTRSSIIDRVEVSPEEDLGMVRVDTKHVAWRSRNKAEEELAAHSARAWARAMEVRGQATMDPAWPEMPEGMEQAETVIEPLTEEGRGPEPAVDYPKLEGIAVDTPPRNDAAEEGRIADAAPNGALQAMPAGAPELTPAAEEPAGSERASVVLPPRVAVNPLQGPGSSPVAGSQQARAGSSVQEEEVMDAMRQLLRGRADRLQAFT